MQRELLLRRSEQSIATGRRVLVVEDSEVVGRVIRVILEGEGYQVTAARGGLDALTLAARLQPNAVTLDLSLPDLDGRQVLRRLKASPQTRDIPVIVLCSFVEVLETADRQRAARVITKPFDVDELLEGIQHVTAQ